MNRYIITTEAGRIRGAIGQFYPITRCYRGDTPEEAIEAFREDIETNCEPTATLANYNQSGEGT